MLITSILIFKLFVLNNSLAEWIDMPQFSDEKKIYRVPTTKQDFYKFSEKNTENQFFYLYQNMTYENTKTEQTLNNETGEYNFYKIKNNIKEPTILKPFDKENVFITNAKRYVEAVVPLMIKKGENKHHFNDTLILNDTEFLNYLPIDILKSVHRTLKSQPTSSEGKIQFLKTFENTLMTEIDFQLLESVMAHRRKRGTEHYDHNYDHEHAAGFPSIEGALMAISFLTFAVYLVRLVMLLFRNMNNSAATTTGATLLLGRRRKSINKFDDEMAIILKGLHNFSSKL